MARKPTDFGPVVNAEIEARTARGESAETIANALGLQKNIRTIYRRQAQLKGKNLKALPARPLSKEQNAVTTIETPDVPDEVPTDTPTEQLDRWIKRLEQGAAKAEAQGNLAALASIAAKVTALMALKHRSAPLPKPDPNERPDYIELAKQGEERLLTLIRGTFKANGGVESP